MKDNAQSRRRTLCVMLILSWIFGGGDAGAQTPGSKTRLNQSSDYAQLNAETSKQLGEFMHQFHLPSISLAICIGDEMVLESAKGLASIADNRAATTRTPWEVLPYR